VFLRSFLAVAVLALTLVPLAVRADLNPTLAVYDLRVTGSVPGSIGSTFATTIANEIVAAGGVDVVVGPAGMPASRDLDDAKSHGAAYYLSGAVAQVGTGYAVICQLVSVRTGLLVWSSTLQVNGIADLHGQGTAVRQVLFDQIGRSSFPTAKATPPPAGFVASANSEATPTPAPATYAVVTFGGTALPGDRALAVRAVLDVLRGRGATAITDSLQPQDLSISGAQACEDTGAATIVGGSLETVRPERVDAPPSAHAAIALEVYDCRTQQLVGKVLTASNDAPISSDAIRTATASAMNAYFTPASPAPRASPTAH
jgi:hypothetical protein